MFICKHPSLLSYSKKCPGVFHSPGVPCCLCGSRGESPLRRAFSMACAAESQQEQQKKRATEKKSNRKRKKKKNSNKNNNSKHLLKHPIPSLPLLSPNHPSTCYPAFALFPPIGNTYFFSFKSASAAFTRKI